MISIQNKVVVFNLIKFYRAKRPSLAHGILDPLQPFRTHVVLEFKTAVKILIPADTTHDPVHRDGSDSPISGFKSSFPFLLILETFNLRRCVSLFARGQAAIQHPDDSRFPGANIHMYSPLWSYRQPLSARRDRKTLCVCDRE